VSKAVPGSDDPAPRNVGDVTHGPRRDPGSRLPDDLQVAEGGFEGPDVGCERGLIQLVGVQENSFAEGDHVQNVSRHPGLTTAKSDNYLLSVDMRPHLRT